MEQREGKANRFRYVLNKPVAVQFRDVYVAPHCGGVVEVRSLDENDKEVVDPYGIPTLPQQATAIPIVCGMLVQPPFSGDHLILRYETQEGVFEALVDVDYIAFVTMITKAAGAKRIVSV